MAKTDAQTVASREGEINKRESAGQTAGKTAGDTETEKERNRRKGKKARKRDKVMKNR